MLEKIDRLLPANQSSERLMLLIVRLRKHGPGLELQHIENHRSKPRLSVSHNNTHCKQTEFLIGKLIDQEIELI